MKHLIYDDRGYMRTWAFIATFVGSLCIIVTGLVMFIQIGVEGSKAAWREANIRHCKAYVTEGVHEQTKWSDELGCLIKTADGKWAVR